MIFLKILSKAHFYYENLVFFFINFIFRDFFFSKIFFKINLEFKKKNISQVCYYLTHLKKKKYLDKIENNYLNNKDNIKSIFFFPELFIYYLNLRLNGSFEKSFHLKIDLLKNRYLDKKKVFYFRNFELQNLNNYQFNQRINYIKKKSTKRDLIFEGFIKDKKVALVGPAESNKKLGHEIDKFDVVIRTNFLNNSNQPYSVYGSKTDVSYYNSHRISIMPEEIKKSHEDLKWIICKSEKDIKKLGLKNYYNKFRVTKDPMDYFIYEDPMLPQRIIYDIISFNPSNFKLFHFDLYNSKKYGSNYKSWDLDRRSISNSLRSHGPMSCFIFMKNLYKMKFFNVDKDTENVLNLDVFQYGKNLDQNYGNLKYDSEV